MWKKISAATATALIAAAGGTLVVDNQINPYTDKPDRLEIATQSTIPQAGENKVELAKDRPAVTLKKWNGEAALTVSYDKVKASGARAFLTDRMEWKDGAKEVHAYPLPPKEGMEDGGFEIEVVLNEKPDTNVFEFQIEGAEELDFFYQSELTPEEVANGDTRPENVVGSYAVYHKTKANYGVRSINYATGKLFHIYRPLVIDANGVTQWAELSYTSGTLTVSIPNNFLANAAYPVTIDPTFGYTTAGATNTTVAGDDIYAQLAVAPVDGNVVAIAAYVTNNTAITHNLKGVLTASTTLILNTEGISDPTVSHYQTTNFNWFFMNLSTTSPITSGSSYLIGYIHSGGVNSAILKRDAGTTLSANDQTNSYATPADWGAVTAFSASSYSIYAIYECIGCETTTTFTSSGRWVAPTGVSTADVACWGGGGGGDVIAGSAGGGGGGGAFASSTVAVTPGQSYTVTVGTNGFSGTSPTDGGDSTFVADDKTVLADGGKQGSGTTGGAGGSTAGAASTGDVEFNGGAGGAGNTTTDVGGGGGGAGGPHGAGVNGQDQQGGTEGGDGGAGSNGQGGAGGAGDVNDASNPAGGVGTSHPFGGGGGGGGDDGDQGGTGGEPGGGAGGGEIDTTPNDAGSGQCTITYTVAAAGGGSISPYDDTYFDLLNN